MGGCGSGRQGGRPIADSALVVEIGHLMRTRRAVPGSKVVGSLSWTRGGGPSGNIGYACDMTDLECATLQLRFTVTHRWSNEKRSYTQDVPLSYTEPYFGGKRWWMHCPRNGSRVAKLYCPVGTDTFASRTAWRLGYRSQRESKRDRPFSRLVDLQRKLGAEQGRQHFVRRPKGMWYRTYARHMREYERLSADCEHEMMLMAGKLFKATGEKPDWL